MALTKNNPQQEIFTLCLIEASKIFTNTYDYIPGKETEYPFIFIGEQFSHDLPNKSAVFGKVTQRIHFYHDDRRRRGDLSSMMGEFLYRLREIKETRQYYISITDVNSQVIFDTSTDKILIHGILEVDFLFNYKGEIENGRSN